MNWIKKVSIGIVVVLFVGGVGGYLYLRSSLPQIDGTISVNGAMTDITITRDKNGIPHIQANSLNDALFGLGFSHAQDRLWQMEVNRRTGAGRLSEIMGDATLGTDKFLRTIGFYQAAKRSYKLFDDETKSQLAAYAAGVNNFLDQNTSPLPPEFLILGITPEKWSPIDSVVWTKMMAWDLSGNWFNELSRMQLLTKLSPQEVNQFLPPYPGDPLIELPDLAQTYARADINANSLLAALPDPLPEGAGSNNWVVAGARTNTGKPLLGNDPHLGLAAPALWYLAHLSFGDTNVIGASLPGVPGIVLGRNDHIAWGFTNTGPDTQDLYIEKLNPRNPAQYKTPDGWATFKTRKETIKVKDRDDVSITVRQTRHGPVLSDIHQDAAGVTPKDHVLAFAWTSLLAEDRTPVASSKIMRARNWEDFKNAARDFTSPQQNMVYADVKGNIGYYAPALIPVRKAENKAMGRMPVPGWLSEYDWEGFIPFEELPQLYNPASNMHHTANQKIVPETYPHFISMEWTSPYRSLRIQERLEENEKHSVTSFKSMHADVKSLMADDLLGILLTTRPLDERSRKALTALSTWDGQMTRPDAAPLIFQGWVRQLNKSIYADELGDYFNKLWRHRPVFVQNVLQNTEGQAHWCDNITTEEIENCEMVLQQSLDATLTELSDRYGANMENWNWGEAHFAHSDHLPFSRVPGLNYLFDVTVPSAGGSYTLNVGRNKMSNEKTPFANTHAASYRAIYDFDDLENSLFIHSTGQSGNVLSNLYDSMSEDWADVKYLKMSTTAEVYEKDKLGTLVLKPVP